MSTLLYTIYYSWSSIADSDLLSGMSWLGNLLDVVNWVLWIALILVGAVGAVYGIYIGVQMARADSSEKREESKKRLINVIIAIIVTIALILFFNLLMPIILSSLGVFESSSGLEGASVALSALKAIF